MEAEQTSWLQGQNVAITNSDGKYVWHHKPAAKVLALFLGRGGTGAGFTDKVSALGAYFHTACFHFVHAFSYTRSLSPPPPCPLNDDINNTTLK